MANQDLGNKEPGRRYLTNRPQATRRSQIATNNTSRNEVGSNTSNKQPLARGLPIRSDAQPLSEKTSLDSASNKERAASNLPEDISPKIIDNTVRRFNKDQVKKSPPVKPRQARSLVLRRQISSNARQQKRQQKKIQKGRAYNLVVALVILSTLLVITWAFWDVFPGIKNFPVSIFSSKNEKPTAAVSDQKSSLDETRPKPADLELYKVGKDDPRFLLIDKISVKSRVKRVGSTLDGKPISPNNIFDIGWYEGSDKVNSQGVALLNGHIAGPNKDGVFSELNKLVAGDTFRIEMGDGKVINYTIKRTQPFSGNQLDTVALMQPIDPSKNGIVLVTSLANYNRVVPQSPRSAIVYAVQD